MEKGLIKLPPCGPNEVWAMKDTGSAPHVASHRRHFPGAELRPGDKDRKGAFTTATGDPFGAEGEFTVPFKTQEGHARKVTFENAEVTVPIRSGGKMADEDNALTFVKNGGWVHDLVTNEISRFIRAHGVYRIKNGLCRRNIEAETRGCSTCS